MLNCWLVLVYGMGGSLVIWYVLVIVILGRVDA